MLKQTFWGEGWGGGGVMHFGHRTKSNAIRFYEFNAESNRTKSNYETKLNGEKAGQLWESNTLGKFKKCWNQKESITR